MFEQEQLRFINMFDATGGGGSEGGATKFTRGTIENKYLTNFICVNGDMSLFRQWHQRFITALGHFDQVHEEIVRHLVKEADPGKKFDKVVED